MRRVAVACMCLLIAGTVVASGAQSKASRVVRDPLAAKLRQALAHSKPATPMPFAAPGRMRTKLPVPKVKLVLGLHHGSRTTPRRAIGGSRGVLTWAGWPSQTLANVGRLYAMNADLTRVLSTCSATVVARNVVLTAGHCVSQPNGAYWPNLLFVPGQTWNASNPHNIVAPYGVWQANNWWARDDFRKGTSRDLDWGLIEMKPRSDGALIGDVTGSSSIQVGITYNQGARIYSMGYPATGFWATAAGEYGNGQFACDSAWDGAWNYGPSQVIRLTFGCTMNGGASGGPVFVQLSDGRWVIGGVNDWCNGPMISATVYCVPTSNSLISATFDSRFSDFWNDVASQLIY
jgi:Trypsin-like peptidase domain